MKKILSFMVMLLASTAMSFADSKTLYLIPGAWDANDATEMYVLYMFGGEGEPKFATFTDSGFGYWTAPLDEGYTKIVLIRKEAEGDASFTDRWNQSEDITLEDGKLVFTFATWNEGEGGNSTFTASKLHKVYVQNMQTDKAVKFASWTHAEYYDWPGEDMGTEIIAGKTWYVVELPYTTAFGGFFLSDVESSEDGGQYFKTGGINFDFSSEDNLFYNYYPEDHQAVLTSEALATPAYAYFRANNGGSELKFYKWDDAGVDPLSFTTETVAGVEWMKLTSYKPTISLCFYTYDNSDEDNDKTWGRDFTFTAGQTAYYFAKLTATTTDGPIVEIDDNYYLVYADGYQFNPEENTVNAIKMTAGGAFDFSATLDNTAGNYLYYVIVPAYAWDGTQIDGGQWNNIISPYFVENGYYEMNKVEQHTCACLPTTWKRWQINGVKAKYDISFNFTTMTWESKPYVEATVGASGYATYSHADGLNIGSADAYIVTKTAGGYATLSKIDEDANLPEGTGIILKGEGTYKLYGYPYGAATADVSGNMLVGSGNDTYVITGDFGSGDPRYYTGYILYNDPAIGFYKVNNESANTLAAHKAFLAVPTGATAPEFIGFGETTGISASLNDKAEMINDNAVYDLQGRRVSKPTRGLYIVNGKKVLVK